MDGLGVHGALSISNKVKAPGSPLGTCIGD